MLTFKDYRYGQYIWRNQVAHYRCTNNSLKCKAKIRVDEKLKFAEHYGKHNHPKPKKSAADQKPVEVVKIKSTPPPTPQLVKESSPKQPEHDAMLDQLFNKEVTTDVELITNDRDVTLMFLKGHKFTKYFENKTHTR